MTDLEEFRDYAWAMADPNPPRAAVGPWCRHFAGPPDHERCARVAPRGRCGCDCHPWNALPSDADRALWARLAAEVADYLAADEAPGLFGEGDQ